MRDFKKLQVWGKSHELALSIYQESRNFPSEERYGLTSQMRRSSASIPTNIAEGCGRSSDKEFINFLTIASGSATELEYQILLAHDLTFINDKNYAELNDKIVEIKKMLYSLIKRIKTEG